MKYLEDKVKINFVYSECENQIKNFLINLSDGVEYINYLEISNKLTKNDFYQCKPSNEVITSYLIKQLNVSLSKDINEIYYVISTLEKSDILKIQSFIDSITNKEVLFNIYYPKHIHLNGTSKLFNSIFVLNEETQNIQ